MIEFQRDPWIKPYPTAPLASIYLNNQNPRNRESMPPTAPLVKSERAFNQQTLHLKSFFVASGLHNPERHDTVHE
jgi:hypothetical protein